MSANIIAEALAAAEQETPAVLHQHRVVVLNQHGTVSGDSDSLDLAEPQDWRTQFVRADVVEAALGHLAARAERAEAQTAEMARAFWAAACEEMAVSIIRDAYAVQCSIDCGESWSVEDVVAALAVVERSRAEAAQLRAWAKEAKP